jgi:Fe2+ or Zn2+ uptake regulation protein
MITRTQGAFRNTTQRSVILQVVENADGHLTAADIYERVRREYPSIAYGTVYRTLHLLASHELIQELTFADQASRFDKRTERHDHVHCSACGSIEDVDVPVALLAQHVAGEHTGYEISNHHTVFVGVCPDCQSTGSDARRARAGAD